MAVPVNTSTTNQSDSVTLGALNDYVILNTREYATVGVQIPTGLTGTVTYTASIDGTNFVAAAGQAIQAQASGTPQITTDTNPTTILRHFDVSAVNYFRVQITAYTSGSCVVSWVMDHSTSAGFVTALSNIIPGVATNALGKAEDAGHTTGDTGVMMLGVRNDNNGGMSGTDFDYTPIATSAHGHVMTQPGATTSAINRPTQHRVASAASTNATNVKAAVGNIFNVTVLNSNAAARYVKFFNKATAPTVGTDTPILVVLCPPTSTTSIGFNTFGLHCTLGIGYSMTVGVADSDVAAVAANDLLMTILYA